MAGRVNWWVHALVILAFLALIPASKHFHLVLSPITVFLKSPELGNVPNLDFEKEAGRARDRQGSRQQDGRSTRSPASSADAAR